MAILPQQYIRQQSVGPARVVPAQAQGVDMSGLARGVGVAGEAGFNLADDIATAQAKGADTDFMAKMSDLLYAPDSGYLSARGGDAMSRHKDVAAAIRKASDDVLGGLDPMARAKAERTIQARALGATEAASRHMVSERSTYLDGQASARVDMLRQTAVYDPTQARQALATIEQEVRDTAARNGLAPEAADLAVMQARSGLHEGVIAQLSVSDPAMALDYLRQNRADMAPASAARLEAALKPEAAKAMGRSLGAAAWSGAGGATGTAMDVLRSFEGFRVGAYWDVNAHRSGFGSDTVTREDGTVERVTAGTQVSRADAERDLERRVTTEFMPRAQAAAGDRWGSMTAQQQAALTSLAYNYGEVPDRVASVIRAGGSDAAVAAAIRDLGGDNDGVNRGRRALEADLFRAGGGLQAIMDISDPDVRDAALREFELRRGAEETQRTITRDQALDAALPMIEGDTGRVDDLTMEQKDALGLDGMRSLRAYEATVRAGRKPETDTQFYVDLVTQMHENPNGFAAQNPATWRDKLNDADYRALTEARASMRGAEPQNVKIPGGDQLFSDMDMWLDAFGVRKADSPMAYAEFRSTVMRWALSNPDQARDPLARESFVRETAASMSRAGGSWAVAQARDAARQAPSLSSLMSTVNPSLQAAGIYETGKDADPATYAAVQDEMSNWSRAYPDLAADPAAASRKARELATEIRVGNGWFDGVDGRTFRVAQVDNLDNQISLPELLQAGLRIGQQWVSPDAVQRFLAVRFPGQTPTADDVIRGMAEELTR